MRLILINLLSLFFAIQVAISAPAGKLQNDDFASGSAIVSAGGSLNQLLNTSKVWDDIHSQLLDTTLSAMTSGSVTSVSASVPSILTVSGVPITASGTIAIALANESSNQVFVGPASGAATTPTFRSLVSADIPTPTATTNGGVQAFASSSSRWLNGLANTGIFSASQPAFSDLSGNISVSQMNSGTNASATTVWAGSGVWITSSSLGSGGTVTNVTESVPSFLNVSIANPTTTPNIALTLANQSANQIFSGPSSGAATSPAFRSLVSADIPLPTTTTNGAVQAIASQSNKWINGLSNEGIFSQSQPAFSNLSGNIQTSSMNSGTNASYQTFFNGAGAWVTSSSIGGGSIGSWTAYTPTISGFGTATSVVFYWRNVGTGTVEIQGRFSAGTVAASTAKLTLPNSYVGSSNFTDGTLCGTVASNDASNSRYISMVGGDANLYFTMSSGTTNATAQVNGNVAFGNNALVQVTALVQVQ